MKKLYKFFTEPEITHGDGDGATITAPVSTEEVNRYGQVVLLSAYDLKNFNRNPVMLQNHGYTNRDVIGRWTKLTKKNDSGVLMGTAEYFMDSEEAAWAYELTKKNLAAFSIGFDVIEARRGDDIKKAEDIPDRVKRKNPYVVFTKIDLLEISQVVIPANPSAVVNCKSSEEHFKYMMEKANEANLYERKIIVNIEENPLAKLNKFLDDELKDGQSRRLDALLADQKKVKAKNDKTGVVDKIWETQ